MSGTDADGPTVEASGASAAMKAAAARDAEAVPAPELPYRPRATRGYAPRIALVGTGGISASHLNAYRGAGYDVAAICNRTRSKAEARRDEYFPDAEVVDDLGAVLARDDVEVLDIAVHPVERAPMIEAAIEAGRHVLSQKPFVLDLDVGERLAELADARGVRLAVNQNGRWAPHLAWIREAVGAGLVGDLVSCHARVHWDHGWIADTAFDAVEDLVLQDFGVHWFDFVASLVGDAATSVFATRARAPGQRSRPPLLAQAVIELPGAQASLVFDGAVPFGAEDATFVAGTAGSLSSRGPDLARQRVTLTTAAGRAEPKLSGTWFDDGFHGAMAELLCAIEDGVEPSHGARDNLASLALTFAAVVSSHRGEPVVPGTVRRLPSALA